MDVILRLLCLAGIFISFGEGVYTRVSLFARGRYVWHKFSRKGRKKKKKKKKKGKITEGLEVFDGHKLGLFFS